MTAPPHRSVSLAVGRRIVNDDVVGRPQAGDPFLAGNLFHLATFSLITISFIPHQVALDWMKAEGLVK